jgi:hypothetical protein
MWETGHFWLLIGYLFTACDDITPAGPRARKLCAQVEDELNSV